MGLSAKNPLSAIMAKLGLEGRKIDVLKVDCEGCEWTAMEPALTDMAEGRLHIGQLLIELHNVGLTQTFLEFFNFWEAVELAGLRIFHKERNGWGCDGVRCLEYAFVSAEHARVEHEMSNCVGPPARLRGVNEAVPTAEENAKNAKQVYGEIDRTLRHEAPADASHSKHPRHRKQPRQVG